ncbi:putative MFS-type transporter [Cercospora beticola]|uniref:Putative MFS-type transporter n=1 Tax=Cercospora beticola TaxID=122368 RepID=A0A2G5HDI4_CERBT|nr:putative MFS-type transporter [Cercospora beticola]PIA90292.1 putative MFS-type transporter [Cercospora beticola]WPB07935.1 hypothetical protein RHO25_012599 [Cercospora beticola]
MDENDDQTPGSQVLKAAENEKQAVENAVDSTQAEPVEYGADKMGTLQRRIVVFSLCLAQFLYALDITIVATALPTIARTLDATASEYAWVGSSYTLASTALTPIWAKMSDVFGTKILLILSSVIFMAGNLIAALSSSAKMLIVGRTFQGVGGAGLQILVTILIGVLFRIEDRAKYYGITAAVWAVAGGLGPVLGGVFTQSLGWRWCFYINMPFGGASLVMLVFALKIETPNLPIAEGLRAVDWTGATLIVAGTILFLLGLETGAGGSKAWGSAEVVCLIVFGVVLLGLFLLFEAKLASNPLIPTRVFSSRTNAASFAVTCLHNFVFIPCDFFIPLYCQVVVGLSPIISGVTMFAFVFPVTFATCLTGWVIKQTGSYVWPMYFGAVVTTIGMGLFIDYGVERDWAKLIMYLVVAGIGLGPVIQAPLIALQANTEPKDLTAAMSAMTFARTLFTSISVVVGSVILQSRLGGSSLSDLHQVRGNLGVYATALKNMWGFYTAMSGLMIPAALLVKSKISSERSD